MTSANDIIQDAVEKLGVYAPNETMSSYDANRGFALLSNLIDEWINDSIYLYQNISITATLFQGGADYAIGPSNAIIVAVRPLWLVQGPAAATITQTGGPTNPLAVVSLLEWNAIYAPVAETANAPNGMPVAMTYIPEFPNGLLRFLPIPDANNYTANFFGVIGMPGFTTLATSYNMAPGQEQALRTNLAVMFNAYFGVGAVTPELLADAQQSKTLLTYTNRLSRALSRRNVLPPTAALPKQ